MNRLRQLWEGLRGSFWFLPTGLVLAAAVVGIVLVEVDYHIETDLQEKFPRVFATGAEGAQGILQAIATSMITVAGVIFSITILILNEASNQYSPRILRNFVRDRSNQLVLGAFLAIFVYCLVVLRAIHDIDEKTFVPPISVLGGIALALVGIGVLIFFIHHIAYSIQASTILQRATAETLKEIDTLYPEDLGAGGDERPYELPAALCDETHWHPVKATVSGYLAYTAPDGLLDFAEEQNTVVRLEYGIGDFVVEETPLASVHGKSALSDQEAERLRRLLSITGYRTIEQDATFGIRQLVDIALKALSPSMNDTTTANMCLDHLTSILARLIQRKMESPCRLKGGKLRVIAIRPTFEELLANSLEQIRQNARGNVRVLRHLTQVVETVMPLTSSRSRLRALRRQLDLVREVAEESVPAAADRSRLLAECDGVLHQLRGRE